MILPTVPLLVLVLLPPGVSRRGPSVALLRVGRALWLIASTAGHLSLAAPSAGETMTPIASRAQAEATGAGRLRSSCSTAAQSSHRVRHSNMQRNRWSGCATGVARAQNGAPLASRRRRSRAPSRSPKQSPRALAREEYGRPLKGRGRIARHARERGAHRRAAKRRRRSHRAGTQGAHAARPARLREAAGRRCASKPRRELAGDTDCRASGCRRIQVPCRCVRAERGSAVWLAPSGATGLSGPLPAARSRAGNAARSTSGEKGFCRSQAVLARRWQA